MSILLNTPSRNHVSSSRSTLWFGCYFVTVMIGGAFLGGWLIRWGLQNGSGAWHDLIVEHGPARILRRFQTLCAVLLAPWMLKKIGWQGFRDLGWHSGQSRQTRKQDFVRWFLIGLLAMCSLFGVAVVSGARNFHGFSFWALSGSLISGFLVTGLGVGIIEETLTRGVLYRSLTRAWSPWPAAVISSLLFAWAHFMKATPESFEQGLLAIVHSSLFADFAKDAVPLKFLNMFLFGLLLCRLVQKNGDIWAAVGLHAAAVGSIKVFSKMTDFDKSFGYQSWIGGHSAKFDDGWALALILCLLLLLTAWQDRQPSSANRVHF
jgi:membrane protease YdiL (CAAX protease family)